MPHQITILPSGHQFTTRENETILEAALREGFPLPYGCRSGACGTCKGKIVEGRVDYGQAQEATLTEEEKRSGLALFCCAHCETDLVIECREIGALKDIQIRTLPCRVEKMVRAAPDVMVLHLKLPSAERLRFFAGQYIDVLLKDGKRRSFSLANAPHDDTLLQLHIRNYAGGTFTDHVFSHMKERDILRFEGPFGTFFLREDTDKPIIFLASGTGFAPVKGILDHAFHKGIQRPMHLYWGCRVRSDLYMQDLAEQWVREHPNFRFTAVLSEARPENHWAGRTGLVHQAVMADYPDLSGHQVYACGAPVMVEAAHRDFTRERGLPDDEFYSDAFTPSVDPRPVG
jgi:CDP-4-dehydro-6-deoxyglucose reductase, E3